MQSISKKITCRRRVQCCWTKKPRAVSHNWTGCDSQMCVNMTFQFPLKVFFVRETEVSAKIDDILNTLLHRTISTQSCAKWIAISLFEIVSLCFKIMLSIWNTIDQSQTNFIQILYTKLSCRTKSQIISKCLFGVFNFFQKTNENTSHSSRNEFIGSFFGRIHSLTICFRKKLTDL